MLSIHVADLAVPSLLFGLALTSAFYVVRFILATLRPSNFPPGPRIIPGLGNLHQLPTEKAFLGFESMSKQYGPILGLKVGPRNLVVLHRADLVHELLQKRGAHYLGRPQMAILSDYVMPGSGDKWVPFFSVDFLPFFRRAVRHHLGPVGLTEVAPVMRAMAGRLLHRLLDPDTDFMQSFHLWTLESSLSVVCGRRAEDMGANWAEEYHDTAESLLDTVDMGVVALLDLFPALKLVPEAFAGWKREAVRIGERIRETYNAMLAHGKKGLAQGIQGRGYEPLIQKLLREEAGHDDKSQRQSLSENDITMIGGGILDAATDTTLATALFLIQALATSPEHQHRAQAEIDGAWGSESIPEHIDLSKLPFLTACVTEVIRWRPTTPVAVPRLCASDEVVSGHRIPAGSTVMINVWAIQHDPDEFDPDRYMRNPLGTKHDDTERDADWRKPLYAFGAGRRACPGEQFAMSVLVRTFALLLRIYDIMPIGDLDLSVETGVHATASVRPKPFKVNFVSRSEKVKQYALEEFERANRTLEELLPKA